MQTKVTVSFLSADRYIAKAFFRIDKGSSGSTCFVDHISEETWLNFQETHLETNLTTVDGNKFITFEEKVKAERFYLNKNQNTKPFQKRVF